MSNYADDVAKYVPQVSDAAVATIVKYCGIALKSTDASLVSSSSKSELDTVRDGFAKKKLGLSAEQAEAGIKTVCEQMKAERRKSRVTFYYLLATATNTLDKLT